MKPTETDARLAAAAAHDRRTAERDDHLSPAQPIRVSAAAGRPRRGVRQCRAASIQTFTALACGVIVLHMVAFTVQSSTLTTLQKSYGLSTFDAGVAYGAYMAGEALSGVLVSYVGGQRRKPRIVAIAMVLTAATCFAHASPHFLFDAEQRPPGTEPTAAIGGVAGEIRATAAYGLVCRQSQVAAIDDTGAALSFDAMTHDNAAYMNGIGRGLNETLLDCDDSAPAFRRRAVLGLYIAASAVMGLGYGPLPILLMLYIDDNAGSKAKASFYQSVFYSVYQLSPVLGYSVAAACLSVYTDLSDVPFTAEDSRWIGAWWLGYLGCGVAILLLAVPLFLFPERLDRIESEESGNYCEAAETSNLNTAAAAAADHDDDEREENKDCRQPLAAHSSCMAATEHSTAVVAAESALLDLQKATDASVCIAKPPDDVKPYVSGAGEQQHLTAKMFLPTMWLFIKNPIYMLTMMMLCTVSWIEAGFFSFLPKYLEVQFHQSASAADMEAGVSGSVMSALAVMAGGWVITKFKLKLKQCTILLFASFALALVFYVAASFCYCPQYIAKEMTFNSSHNCSRTDFRPVCLDKVTYFSPCHAGCQNETVDVNKRTVYSGCLCSDKEAFGDVCVDETCKSIIPFMIFVVLADFCSAFSSMARVTLLLRCVDREHRSFSFGLASELSNFIGWFTAPLLYGWLIDESCLTWDRGGLGCSGDAENDDAGSCLQYDNAAFASRVNNLTYSSAAFGLLLAASICVLAHCCQRHAAVELHSLSEEEEEEINQVREKEQEEGVADGANGGEEAAEEADARAVAA